MRSLEFDIPGLPRTPNFLLGRHWRTRSSHASKWKAYVNREVYLRWKGLPAERVKLTLTRFSSSQPDDDNLRGSFKPVVDGLVQSGVMRDDSPKHLVESVYRWERRPARLGFIRVLIEEVELPHA